MEDKVTFEEVEPMFVVLYNSGNGEMHEVILPYDQQKAIGTLLMRMNNDNIPVNENVACNIKLTKYKVAKKEVGNE